MFGSSLMQNIGIVDKVREFLRGTIPTARFLQFNLILKFENKLNNSP
jgi:hypothetical protein